MENINPNNIKVKFIISESIETQANGTMQRQAVINPALNLKVGFTPTNLTFYITILVGDITSGNYKIAVNIIRLETSERIFESGFGEVVVPNGSSEFTANVELRNLVIPKDGDYEIEFLID